MNADDKLLIELATPASLEEAERMLRHPLAQALDFCEARTTTRDNRDKWHRLAGSIRKAYQEEIDTGHA